jgi:hypothetical protein
MDVASSLQRDLGTFIDPATELVVGKGTQGVRLQFVRNGYEHDYFYNSNDETITARHLKNRKFANVRSLLASPDFADIRGFASTQARMHRDFHDERLIRPEGTIGQEHLSRALLQASLSPLSMRHGERKIGIILIDGPAGVGKTSLIQSVLVQRATRQGEVNAAPPLLHVASRGRRLTGLNDALAQSIQLIRAKFTFDQTPALIRYNLLQVAIDGFDELVDPEGYRDAWFALRDFFEDVSFGGPIILAGRDTFFDQQSFLRQIQAANYSIDLVHVRLHPSSPSTAREWLRKRGWADKDIKDPYTNIVLRIVPVPVEIGAAGAIG